MACGNSNNQERKADLAIRACLQHLSEITPEDTSEREVIRIALDDLRILKALCRKYGRIG
jgi:hypothetical protein